MKNILIVTCLVVALGLPIIAQAELVDHGNGLIYDTVQNITWYDAPRVRRNQPDSVLWATNLSVTDVNGVSITDWRLPSTMATGQGAVIDSEMADLYYNGLGNEYFYFENSGPFVNLVPNDITLPNLNYWTGNLLDGEPSVAWDYHFQHGFQHSDPKGNLFYALAVHDGKVGEPIDTDSDRTLDCNDNCPNDSNKTEPGECGCGIADTDSDEDGIADCNDDCDNRIDSDGDGAEDCLDINDDNDALPDNEEQGPNLDDPNYDGNNDGIADCVQDNVVSFHSFDGQYYMTIESSIGTSISNFSVESNPSSSDAPSNVQFPLGFIWFTIEGVDAGENSLVTLYLPSGENANTYYIYGTTPDDLSDHWYEFSYDNYTGSEIDGNIINIHLIDGERGDDDITANGTIVGIGAPGIFTNTDSITQADSSSGGGGGGGCFIGVMFEN